jgi:hypothetical protein
MAAVIDRANSLLGEPNAEYFALQRDAAIATVNAD